MASALARAYAAKLGDNGKSKRHQLSTAVWWRSVWHRLISISHQYRYLMAWHRAGASVRALRAARIALALAHILNGVAWQA